MATTEEERDPETCTCGAREYSGCFCKISLRDFLATGPDRRV